MIDLRKVVLGRWGYRQAEVTDVVFTVKFDRGDDWGQLREELAMDFGGIPDNYEVYELKTKSGKTLYVGFSDWTVVVGLGVCHN